MKTFKAFVNEAIVIKIGSSGNKEKHDAFMKNLHSTSKEHPFNHRMRIIGKASVHVSPGPDGIHLHDIVSHDRNSGAGSKALKHLTSLADKHKVSISGIADAYEDRKHTGRLKNWYVRHGFTADPNGSKIDGYKIKYTPKGS